MSNVRLMSFMKDHGFEGNVIPWDRGRQLAFTARWPTEQASVADPIGIMLLAVSRRYPGAFDNVMVSSYNNRHTAVLYITIYLEDSVKESCDEHLEWLFKDHVPSTMNQVNESQEVYLERFISRFTNA